MQNKIDASFEDKLFLLPLLQRRWKRESLHRELKRIEKVYNL